VATLTIRGLDDDTKARLRVSAAEHGRSMEAEVRAILQEALPGRQARVGLGSRIHARFSAVGGLELEPPDRSEMPHAPTLKA
jgi:plasmid stability protein